METLVDDDLSVVHPHQLIRERRLRFVSEAESVFNTSEKHSRLQLRPPSHH